MEQQTLEAAAFLSRITSLPKGADVSLDDALKPSLDDEADLRKLFAKERTHERLKNPHVGLVNVFNAPQDIRTTRERSYKTDHELSRHYVMPLTSELRRKEGTPAMVADLDEFRKNWSVFTEGSLSQLLDWNNVVAAGGSVLACLAPLPETAKVSKRAMRKFYHSAEYPTSDVDLFLWGLTAEQAEKKIVQIYEAVRDSVPWDVTCVRSKHTISIHSQYPYRSVQIILRLYSSPAEILAGFDIDAPCCAYDGQNIWANPRAIVAMMRQCNTVDVTRRSPSYEVRLAKYSQRGFEVYVPDLKREDVDPTIYERSIFRIEGLARLLVFEKLFDTNARDSFLSSRRRIRGRPTQYSHKKYKRILKGDLKADMAIGGLDMNDYDVASLHIPYGPGWDARRIDKLIYQTDLGMNSTFNPKNKDRRLHRHPAFFGTIEECMEDCCEHCPEAEGEEEIKLQTEEEEKYVRGRIKFLEDDPGRQTLSGSFNPINEGEWAVQVYIGPTDKLFAAVAGKDRAKVAEITRVGFDFNRRDHVGRTALHVAIISGAQEIACDLIEAGARITARLADGRNCLHLAAQYDQLAVVRKVLDQSAVNEDKEKNKLKEAAKVGKNKNKERAGESKDVEMTETDDFAARESSEDDWSSQESEAMEVDLEDENKSQVKDDENDSDHDEEMGDDEEDSERESEKSSAEGPPETVAGEGDIPEDEDNEPDILEIDLPDWDFEFTALAYAILYGSLQVIEALLVGGSNAQKSFKEGSSTFLPLTLTLLIDHDDRAIKIIERLLRSGATSSIADKALKTAFHVFVAASRPKLTAALLRADPNAATVIDQPSVERNNLTFPLVTAINNCDYSSLAVLLAYGAQTAYSEEKVSRLTANQNNAYNNYSGNLLSQTYMPVETAVEVRNDAIQVLANLGAELSIPLRAAQNQYVNDSEKGTVLDWVRFAIYEVKQKIKREKESASDATNPKPFPTAGWKGYVAQLKNKIKEARQRQADSKDPIDPWPAANEHRNLEDLRQYFEETERLLVSLGAKTWNEVFPNQKIPEKSLKDSVDVKMKDEDSEEPTMIYRLHTSYYNMPAAGPHLVKLYNELYEACFSGDDTKIQQLCLPREKSPQKDVLQISVQTNETDNKWNPCFTPLNAAIAGRKWETARLVIAIATAQFVPEEGEAKFSTRNMNLDGESDSDADDSDAESDVTVDQVNFTDVAHRSSAVQCKVGPSEMLHELKTEFSCIREGKDAVERENLIFRAIYEGDTEAFAKILDLYKLIPDFGKLLKVDILNGIIAADQPEMFDEYVRRTGLGLDLSEIRKTQEGELELPSSEKRKLYLGLNVHGKKRHDLAKRSDPDAEHHINYYVTPVLWTAATYGSLKCIEYLDGDRPLAAYRYYYMTNSDERANRLRRVSDLEKALPTWLGWTISPLNESPLTAAILGNRFEAIKLLFAKAPKLMASALHEKVKFVGLNSLQLSVELNNDTKIIDFLLSKKVSPLETDHVRGWNILHAVCKPAQSDLLAYLLQKLPKDVVQVLLEQQSKKRLNTPLHLAACNSDTNVVEKLLSVMSTASLLLRNVDGQTALHHSVEKGLVKITRLLLAAMPKEAVLLENGVGDTPLEIANRNELRKRTGIDLFSKIGRHAGLSPHYINYNPRYQMDETRDDASVKKIALLRTTLDDLLGTGKLRKNTNLTRLLYAFAEDLETKYARAKAEYDETLKLKLAEKKQEPDGRDYVDLKEVAEIVKFAVPRDNVRRLVHLIDVQRSVQGSLPERTRPKRNYGGEDGLEDKEDAETVERRSSHVLASVRISVDCV